MRPQGAFWSVKLPFAFTPRPLCCKLAGVADTPKRVRNSGDAGAGRCRLPGSFGAAQSTPEAVVVAKGSCPLSHAAVPAKGTLQPFANPRTGTILRSPEP